MHVIEELVKWAFHEKGVYKVVSSRHYHANDTTKLQPEFYQVGNTMVSSLK